MVWKSESIAGRIRFRSESIGWRSGKLMESIAAMPRHEIAVIESRVPDPRLK
jgi:hypothetical protein